MSAPSIRGNLAVYPIHGPSDPRATFTTLDRALASGEARVVNFKNGFKVQNLAGVPLLVPFGTLLQGGRQDQVVGAGLIVPPRSGFVDLTTFCVDPFRSSARVGDEGLLMKGVQAQIPSLTARLSMLSGSQSSDLYTDIRQSGVWWGIDTIQERLSQRIGHRLSPTKPAAWKLSDDQFSQKQLRDRSGGWVNSLPLALDDRGLTQMERPLQSALQGSATSAPDVIGMAFVINGRFVGAEIDTSHALFEQNWSAILRSYVVESLVAGDRPTVKLPSAKEIADGLNPALSSARTRQVSDMTVYDLDRTMVAETADAGGVVEKIILPKLDGVEASAGPAALVVTMLEADKVNGVPLESLREAPQLARVVTSDHATARPHAEWKAITSVAVAAASDEHASGALPPVANITPRPLEGPAPAKDQGAPTGLIAGMSLLAPIAAWRIRACLLLLLSALVALGLVTRAKPASEKLAAVR